MIRLRVLGSVELYDGRGAALTAVPAQPKRFALLAFLAVSPAALQRRDVLRALFWPELDDARARDALNQAVRVLRRTLGSSVIANRGAEELGIDRGRLWCDALAFRDACAGSRFAEALEHYRGDLLEGFHASDAPGFENWLERERGRLRGLAARAARAVAESKERETRYTTAVSCARRAVDLSDLDERAVRELLKLLDRLGDRAGALHAYESFAERLRTELDARPSAETLALVEDIRRRSAVRQSLAVADGTSAGERAHAPGALLGGWILERELGRGGTSTVYLARDAKHDRQVALKLLRPADSSSADAGSFLREIRLTARLAHPHILPLLDSGTSDGTLFLVTPYVSGETLRERLRHERQLAIDEAIRIAGEIAAALDYAHRQGVIHRDIKPENVLLQDGRVLLADFGIAQSLRVEATSAGTDAPGTPAYMSPEQAAGRVVDARSDVYALAAVLYEMLTGDAPHAGGDAQSELSRVLTQPVLPVRQLRESVPAHVEQALAKALAKLPADRFSSVADFARALGAPPASRIERDRGELERPPGVARTRWMIGAAGVLVLVIGAVAATSARPRDGREMDARPRRYTIVLPDTAPISLAGSPMLGVSQRALAISPDASTMTYVAAVGRATMLYVRQLDEPVVRPLPGTEGAHAPFFSPDGRWIGFFAGARLLKVPAAGGVPVLLAELIEPYSAVWLPDGRIIVSEGGGTLGTLSDQGGTPSRPRQRAGGLAIAGGSIGRRWLPAHGERELVFVSLEDGEQRHVLTSGGTLAPRESIVTDESPPRTFGLSPSIVSGSHLLYALPGSDGVMVTVPFDTARMVAMGPPVALPDRVRIDAGDRGVAQYAVADDGTMLYVAGRNEMQASFVLRQAPGQEVALPIPRTDIAGWLSLSRDGRRLVARQWEAGTRRRWTVFDLADGSAATMPARFEMMIWAPDSRTLLASDRRDDGGRVTVRVSPTTGAVLDTVLHDGGAFAVDTHERVFAVRRSASDVDAWIVRRDTVYSPVRVSMLLGETIFPFPSTLAAISPSGAWIALTVRIGGRSEIFLAPTARPNERTQLTRAGGEEPRWSADGRRIVYRNRDAWYVVDVAISGDSAAFGRPRLLLEGSHPNVPGYSYALTPDGYLVLVAGPPASTATRIEVIDRWNPSDR